MNTDAISGGYLGNHMSDSYRTNTSVMRTVHAGEWNVFLGWPRGTFRVNSTRERIDNALVNSNHQQIGPLRSVASENRLLPDYMSYPCPTATLPFYSIISFLKLMSTG